MTKIIFVTVDQKAHTLLFPLLFSDKRNGACGNVRDNWLGFA